MTMRAPLLLLALGGLFFAACGGAASNLAVNWVDNRPVRTCAGSATGYTRRGAPP